MLKRTFKIDNTLYPSEKIQEVIHLFEGYDIVYNHPGEITITSSEEDPQAIFDEFMNYLLAYLNE